ncbi:hypothetical protein GGR92_004012 [Spirosoma lacussanchae]|uniref:DUF7005 family protein n=1 Tax=Spirosoma lacussanchae TaxID=1884249 RepID=UPI001107C09B|nr:hypothetical protein [Spirosoma lacussanchae]
MTAPSPNRLLRNSHIALPDELEAYLQNNFSGKEISHEPVAVDEPYGAVWAAHLASQGNVFQLLQACYPQLNFPIQDGINKTQAYIDTVLKGKPCTAGYTPVLSQPERLRLHVHTSLAGNVPVLIVPDHGDFVRLVQCFLHKNNPMPVPASMGASLLNGLNNWERIHALKRSWLRTNPAETWTQEFSKNVLPNPGLYKDKLILLSTKPYSNVPADRLGLTEAAWAAYSLSIRLEHECTHLYTLRRFGCATNNLHDELIADYMGISKALGTYRKDWMLAFMGLEAYPAYRKGARLENYLGDTNLTPEGFSQLTAIIKQAIESIARFDTALGPIRSAQDQMCRMDALCTTDLINIASVKGANTLLQTYQELAEVMKYNQND